MTASAPNSTLSGTARTALWVSSVVVALPFLGIAIALIAPNALIQAPALDAERLAEATLRSVTLALSVALFSSLLGLMFAWVQVRWRFPASVLLTRLSILPMVLPSFLLAATLRESFAPLGLLGEPLGLRGRFEGLAAAILCLTLTCTPYVQLVVAAALRRLPAQQLEAARLLGASPWRSAVEITLPALRPALGFGLLLVLVYALADFGAVAVLDAPVLTFELYQFAGRGGPQAPLIGLVLCATVAPLVWLSRHIQGNQDATALSDARRRSSEPVSPAKRYQIAAWIGLSIYLVLALVVPLFLIVRWTFVGTLSAPIWEPALLTLLLGLCGAGAAIILGSLPAAVVAAAKGKRLWLEYVAFMASSIPGVLVAFGLLQVLLRWPEGAIKGVLEGGFFLVLALGMRFSSHVYGAVKPSLLTESPRPIEAARSLGASPWRILRRIRLPQLAPGLAAGFTLAFIAIIKELPMTLMLLPAGQSSLATRIFDAHEDAHLGDLGASALVLLAMVLVGQALLRRWEQHD
jgi:iron(III) transport system permease protein